MTDEVMEPSRRRVARIAMANMSGLALTAAIGLATVAAVAQERPATELLVYQQRTADGRIMLTDRPLAGAATQRTWRLRPDDPGPALQRREEARLEARLVSERIQRQLDREQQRGHEFALERLRLAQAQAQLDAERARAQAAQAPLILFLPRFVPRVPRPGPPPFPRPWQSR